MAPVTKPRALAIGAASRATGVNIETIRYYERIGLMPAVDRSAGGARRYDGAAVARLRFIRRCRELGFAIDEIRSLLAMADRRDLTCGEMHRVTVGHLASVRKKIESLTRLATVLDGMAATCSRGQVPDCPVIDALWPDAAA